MFVFLQIAGSALLIFTICIRAVAVTGTTRQFASRTNQKLYEQTRDGDCHKNNRNQQYFNIINDYTIRMLIIVKQKKRIAEYRF